MGVYYVLYKKREDVSLSTLSHVVTINTQHHIIVSIKVLVCHCLYCMDSPIEIGVLYFPLLSFDESCRDGGKDIIN